MSLFRVAASALFAIAVATSAHAQEDASGPRSLSELLEEVRRGSQAEEMENVKREREFAVARDRQRELLTAAMEEQAAAEARSTELELFFEDNENKLADLEETLRKRLGTLGEIFGVVRQVAGDTQTRIRTSLVSAQIPGREELLVRLAQSKELPSIDDLEQLWLTLQEEMTEQGRIVKFPATVISVGGEEATREVIRIGPFNAISDGKFLRYLSENGKLAELGRQPSGRYLQTIADYGDAEAALTPVAIDPSRGTLLSLLIQSPSLRERVSQGGLVGYVILVLGGIGVVLALYRLARLAMAGRKIQAQVGEDTPCEDNALGRILSVYSGSSATDTETLELRLDEAILKETSVLRRGTTLIKVLAVVAPLLGLLGTVTGMIETFQAITLFGTGDPKLMAGGISQALVTTVLGLCAAIPLTMLHSVVAERARVLIELLEEHSVGMVAEHAESLAAAEAEEEVFGLTEAINANRDFLETGGWVLTVIAGVTFVMWTLILERYWYLYVGHPRMIDDAIAQWAARRERKSWHAHQVRRGLVSKVSLELGRSIPLIKTLVALCPLLGLLGTVTGMIEVFDVMAIAGSGNPRAMASGVSKATIPTMAGMVAALSGFIFSAQLDQRYKDETERVSEHLTPDGEYEAYPEAERV